MSLINTASLIVTPNAYSEGKLYSVIPSDGSGDLSVTRATTATRVNSAGLVELVPYNLVRYSEQFDNAAWAKLGTALTVTANTTIAPDGTLTADTLNVSNNDNILYQANSSGFAFTGNTYTFSIYAKGTGTFDMRIRLNSATTTSQVKTLTNEWQRFEVSVTNSVEVTSVETYLGLNTSSTYFVWGAQLNEGALKDYQKTETRLNIPRLDYSNGTCPSILVEPQRTNLLTWSSSFDNGAWTKLLSSVTANAAISPSGLQDAYKLIESTGTGAHRCGRTSGSVNGTFSFYAKAAERTKVAILSTIIDVGFDLSNGTLIDLGSGTTNATIQDAGNGWYRCSLYQATGISGVYFALLNDSGNFSYTGDGTSGAYFWGAQIENASYATSYIPTQGSTVTRNADVISKTGIADLIGQTEGTIFAEFIHNGANITTTQSYFTISSGNNNNIITIGTYTNRINPTVRASNVSIFDVFAGPNPLTEGVHKIAIGYKSGDFAIYLDGASILTSAASATFGTMGQLDLGNSLSNNWQLGDGIKATALWKTRLTNAQLTTLTTI